MERPPKAPAKAHSRGESAPELPNLLGVLTLYLLSCAGVERFINSSKTPRKKTAAEKALLVPGGERQPRQEVSPGCLEHLENAWRQRLLGQQHNSPPALCRAGCPGEN